MKKETGSIGKKTARISQREIKGGIIAGIAALSLGLTGCGNGSAAGSGTAGSAAAGNTAPGSRASAVSESYGNTEYGSVRSYVDYTGTEALPDNADAKTVVIAYGYSGYPIAYTEYSRKRTALENTALPKHPLFSSPPLFGGFLTFFYIFIRKFSNTY